MSRISADRALVAFAGAAVVFGVVVRIVHFGDTILGDELSTLYIVQGHSLRDVLHLVRGDAEISPPLYFALAWIATQLGSAPELIRLPALIGSLASIPLAYLVARRLFGSSAGLVAAVLMALNPFMIFYATEGRSYTVAIALLLASTLAMLIAADRGGLGWWGAYAALVVLAMYTHYTCAFVLGAQLIWLLWARPQARIPGLAATGAAALVYLPWIPGVLADFRSPTADILSALEGNGISLKLQAIASWAFGYPYNSTDAMPGQLALLVGIAAVVLLMVAGGAWLISCVREDGLGARSDDQVQAFVLALALALATPVAEAAVLLAGGTDLLGARNLNTASGGFAVLIGGIAAVGQPTLARAGVAAMVAVFVVGAVRSLNPQHSTIDFKGAANFIDGDATHGDAVLDLTSAQLSPVPTTSIEAHLSDAHPLFTVYQPPGQPPLLRPCPPRRPIVRMALNSARGHRLFVIGEVRKTRDGVSIPLVGRGICVTAAGQPEFGDTQVNLPGWRLEDSRSFEGLGPIFVNVLGAPHAAGP